MCACGRLTLLAHVCVCALVDGYPSFDRASRLVAMSHGSVLCASSPYRYARTVGPPRNRRPVSLRVQTNLSSKAALLVHSHREKMRLIGLY
eukprot:209484-Rhodomonas_salina.5